MPACRRPDPVAQLVPRHSAVPFGCSVQSESTCWPKNRGPITSSCAVSKTAGRSWTGIVAIRLRSISLQRGGPCAQVTDHMWAGRNMVRRSHHEIGTAWGDGIDNTRLQIEGGQGWHRKRRASVNHAANAKHAEHAERSRQGVPGRGCRSGGALYKDSSAVVKSNRPEGIAVMALFHNHLGGGLATGRRQAGRRTASHWVSSGVVTAPDRGQRRVEQHVVRCRTGTVVQLTPRRRMVRRVGHCRASALKARRRH